MQPGGSMPHSQGHSNNPYREPNYSIPHVYLLSTVLIPSPFSFRLGANIRPILFSFHLLINWLGTAEFSDLLASY